MVINWDKMGYNTGEIPGNWFFLPGKQLQLLSTFMVKLLGEWHGTMTIQWGLLTKTHRNYGITCKYNGITINDCKKPYLNLGFKSLESIHFKYSPKIYISRTNMDTGFCIFLLSSWT